MQELYTGLDNLNNIVQSNSLQNVLIVSGERVVKTQFVADALKNLKANYGVFRISRQILNLTKQSRV